MADIYLRSTDGSDASDGLTWANAKATLAAALTAAGAGGTVYVSDNHAQSSTTINPTGGTAAAFIRVICVDDTGDPEPPTTLATGATITVTSGNINFGGFLDIYGLTFIPEDQVSTAALSVICFTDCTFDGQLMNSVGDRLLVAAGAKCLVVNPSFLGVAGGNPPALLMHQRGYLEVRGGSVAAGSGGTIPPLFCTNLGDEANLAQFIGLDLSVFGSGTALAAVTEKQNIKFIDCKLGASVAPLSGTVPGASDASLELVNSDDTDTNYRFYRAMFTAIETSETTVVRTSGASDGTTSFSRKVVANANPTVLNPYVSLPMAFWNETTGSNVTVTIPVLTDGVTLTDAEAWIEVEYLGTSGFPRGLFASDRITDPYLGTPANQPTDGTSSWNDGSLTSPVKQSLSVTFTPEEKGVIRVRVCVAKASTTVYYDPKVLDDSGRQYQMVGAVMNEGASGGGGGGLLTHPGMSGGMRG